MALAAIGLLALGGAERTAVSAAPTGQPLQLGVVAIDARIGDERVRSSGTIVDARAGLVVTTAHAVWGATSLRLTTGLGVLHGRLVARAPCAGLAVIEIQPRLPGLTALVPAAAGTPPPTELLSAVGRREGELVTIPTGVAGTVEQAVVDPVLPPLEGALRLDGAIVPESSGGPVVNAAGEVVGMAVAGPAGEDALAVPWSTVRARIAELQVDARRIFVGWREHYRCAGALHAYARAEHSGYRRADARINAPVPATRLPGTEGLDSR